MKSILLLAPLVLGACTIAEQSGTSSEDSELNIEPEPIYQVDGNPRYRVIRDRETGCEYIHSQWYQSNIVPRQRPDGTQVCN